MTAHVAAELQASEDAEPSTLLTALAAASSSASLLWWCGPELCIPGTTAVYASSSQSLRLSVRGSSKLRKLARTD